MSDCPIPAPGPGASEEQTRDAATASDPTSAAPPPDFGASVCASIGRYRVERVLGEGAFGTVYLAHDDELRRPVAIKVPKRARLAAAGAIEQYLTEARVLAGLDHPGIVPVYDFGRTEDGSCYVVSKYIAGSDLAHRLRSGPLAPADAAEVVAGAAEALHHAHEQGLVHRDIKPANLLLDDRGTVHVADFGLALHLETDPDQAGTAGTPAYMSPEQARGEGHALDVRSDVFSLGVVLYELLTGKRPFQGRNLRLLLSQVIYAVPVQPHYLNAKVSAELSRICLRCLAKAPAERYRTAQELAAALRRWQRNPAGLPVDRGPEASYLPENGRPFGPAARIPYLELLQGYRGVGGAPAPLQSCRAQIEHDTMPVVLVTGAPGSGKSSFVQAGLLPLLSERVRAVVVVADPVATEARFRAALDAAVPGLPEVPLAEALDLAVQALADRKLLLVLDQFERWLLAHGARADSDLGRALRTMDGTRLQCLLVVRDDFRVLAGLFLAGLGLPLGPAEKVVTLEPLDRAHAARALALLGHALAALPEDLAALSITERLFLDNAILALALEGKVCPLRLAQFATALRGTVWPPPGLRKLGGPADAVAVLLEERFAATGLDLQRPKAARAVLKALLPAAAAAAPGPVCARKELRQAAGYAGPAQEFADVIEVLDAELRLITPMPPSAAGARTEDADTWLYRLTDPALAPVLRRWIASAPGAIRLYRAQPVLSDKQLGFGGALPGAAGKPKAAGPKRKRPSPFKTWLGCFLLVPAVIFWGFLLLLSFRYVIGRTNGGTASAGAGLSWPDLVVSVGGFVLVTVVLYLVARGVRSWLRGRGNDESE